MSDVELVRFHSDDGIVSAFIVKGRKWIKVVCIDSPISVRKVNIVEEKFMKTLQRNGQDYPITRARNKFLKAGRKLGITQGARDILNAA